MKEENLMVKMQYSWVMMTAEIIYMEFETIINCLHGETLSNWWNGLSGFKTLEQKVMFHGTSDKNQDQNGFKTWNQASHLKQWWNAVREEILEKAASCSCASAAHMLHICCGMATQRKIIKDRE